MLRFNTLDTQVKALLKESQSPTQRIATGLPTIDKMCGGPAKGEVYTIIGRSFTGKSIVGQNIILHNRELPSIFFSLEMPAIQAIKRLYSMWSGMRNDEVQRLSESGRLPTDQLLGLSAAFPHHIIVDQSGINLSQMSEYLYLFKEMYDQWPAFVMMDYLELIGGVKKSGEGWSATEAMAASIKDWAKDHEIPVFLLHQTNMKEDPWSAPTMNSARGAGFTESDFVIGIWTPAADPELDFDEYQRLENSVYLNVLKNRAYGTTKYNAIHYRLRPSLRLEEAW